MSSPYEHIKKGALHRQLHVPEGELIPEATMSRICHGTIGEHIMSHGHDVPITSKLKKRACFGLNLGYHK